MLLLTDRLNEGLRLREVLGLPSCTVLAMHQAAIVPAERAVIICDVALDSGPSLELLRRALAQQGSRRNARILCLTRDSGEETIKHAQAIGATVILPYNTPHAKLLSTINQLAGFGTGSRDEVRVEVKSCVQEAGTILLDVLDAGPRRQPITSAALDRGGQAVIAAIGKARIQAWLDVVWEFDDVTYQHCLLVAGLVAAFSLKLGLSLATQRLLCQAALIHDVGKASIPPAILNKPGQLVPAEMAVMKTHAALGHQRLVAQGGFDPRLLDVVRHHHEYLDGSGYPDGLQRQQLSNYVRLVTICDIYAALIERRPYKSPMTPKQALAILVDMGPKLDVGLVRTFHSVVAET